MKRLLACVALLFVGCASRQWTASTEGVQTGLAEAKMMCQRYAEDSNSDNAMGECMADRGWR